MALSDQELMWAIHRAAHFEWRRAALSLAPGLDPLELVKAYWREVGRDTGRSWVKGLDRSAPLAPQVAERIAAVSRVMGEDAVATPEGVTHRGCPWAEWHRRQGVLAEDRPGCDAWLEASLAAVDEALGCRLRFETVESIPEGGRACVRRIWEEGR
ncbi:hypothetical protein L6R50_12720 [Myxococcota bacterium]|nr:hypothetical protein [Myxococcota bacterium]